jgi:hypothetical protein
MRRQTSKAVLWLRRGLVEVILQYHDASIEVFSEVLKASEVMAILEDFLA